MENIRSLLKDPEQFQVDLLKYAQERNVTLDPDEINSFLQAELKPENVSPVELLAMLSDPRTAICDPSIVSKLIEAKNMTNAEIQRSLKPLCNLSLEDALTLLSLAQDHVDWQQIQAEVAEFTVQSGGSQLSFSQYKQIFEVSRDVRRDMFQKESINKVFGDVSNLLRNMQNQMTMELNQKGSENLSNNTLFMNNISTNGRLAFAAIQRVVCGRNMSADQLFSDGGAANR